MKPLERKTLLLALIIVAIYISVMLNNPDERLKPLVITSCLLVRFDGYQIC